MNFLLTSSRVGNYYAQNEIVVGERVASGHAHGFILANGANQEEINERVTTFKSKLETLFLTHQNPFRYLKEYLDNYKHNQFAVVFIYKEVLYFYLAGDFSLSLLRSFFTYPIAAGKTEKLISGSGRVKDGDIVVFGKKSFFTNTFNELAQTLFLSLSFSSFDFLNEGAIAFSYRTIDTKPLQRSRRVVLPFKTIQIKSIKNKLAHILPQKSIYLGKHEDKRIPKKKINSIVLGIIVFIVLVISIIAGLKQNEYKKQQALYTEQLNKARHSYDEAKSIAGLNITRTRELLKEAKGNVLGVTTESKQYEDAKALLTEIEESMGKLGGIYNENPVLYLDLTLVTQSFSMSDVSFSEGNLAVLSESTRKLIKINLSSKKTETYAVPQILKGNLKAASYADSIFVLSEEGIWRISELSRKVIEEEFSSNDSIKAYTGNIYLLSKDDSIWKYQGVGGGQFSPRQQWVGTGISINLQDMISWSIDGTIIVLNQNGNLIRFVGGIPEQVYLTNIPEPSPFVPNDFYTDQDINNYYFLDRGNNRVVVTDKKGVFVAEYTSHDISQFSRIIVSEKDKKIFLIGENKITYLTVKHI